MNTTRDELLEQIAELADQFACGAAGEPVVYALHGPMDFAEEAIALVTAARDAEILAALRSEEAIDHAAAVRDWTGCGFTSPRDTSRWLHMDPGIKEWEREQVRATLQAALDAIGLHGDGTGGQG